MMVGKMENTSASYIDPTADVMRASSERTAQTKQDAQKNAAEGLLETNAVYKLDISGEGWTRMEAEKRQRVNEQDEILADGNFEDIVVGESLSENLNWVGIRYTADTFYEVCSLASNMITIEKGIATVFQSAQQNDKNGLRSYGLDMRELGLALNAYGHKQKEAIADGKDTYLTGILDRLNQLNDNMNPVVQQLRDMVETTLHGRDIDVNSEEFRIKTEGAWKNYQKYKGLDPLDVKTKDIPEAIFNEKLGVYSYMQELVRRQAEQEKGLLDDMLGEGEAAKNHHAVGEVLNTSLGDGLAMIRNDREKARNVMHEDGTRFTEAEQVEEDKKIEPAVSGYDWKIISQKYLQENPDVAAVLADISLPG